MYDMVENIMQLYDCLKDNHETTIKETIKILFMYIMIHKLDLYINIAFHPKNNQNSVKRNTGLAFRKVKLHW